jgi:Hemerythrin HHE cation binding domain
MATSRKPAERTASKKVPVKKMSTAAKKPYKDNTADNTTPPKSSPKDAVDLLVADHLAAGKCFKQYQTLKKRSASAAQRQAVADKVCGMLTVHTRIEEEIFYPAAREAGIDPDEMDEANVEHGSAKDLIAQIQADEPDTDYYDAKVKVLSDLIEHHVIEEHTEMFPKCRRSKMDLVALRARMDARKRELESGN